jgi:Domain of unknown function (DUF4864)
MPQGVMAMRIFISMFPMTALALASLLVLWARPASAQVPGATAERVEKSDSAKSATAVVNGLTPSDREKIRRVITLQIRAFERNDEAIAFAYASPETRKSFGTPHNFMMMVRADYALLIKHTSREFLEAATVAGVTVQPLKVVTTEGETVIALYTMEQQPDREWRIGGCELAPANKGST